MLKLPKIPSNVLSSNAGIINEVYSNDNDNPAFSFNYEVKKYEVTENLVFFELVQNAFAPRYAEGQHRVKRVNGTFQIMPNH